MAFRSSKSNSTTMSLGEHLGELRMRLIRSIIAVALGASAILAFYDVPALNKKEKQYTIPFIVSSVVLFATGGALAYWTLSKALEFLISWSGTEVNQAFQITKYVSLVILMILAFGVGFLTPLLIVFLQLVGVVTPKTLIKQWRIAIVAIFFVAAVITPSGDPITLMALGLPLTFLYFVAILIGFIAIRKRARRDE
ncbi:MAG: hypothetical protein EBX80_00215 [Acidimicrobiia bacterium]|nr:hypothetical protein [Acidimicrobiia bacterium]